METDDYEHSTDHAGAGRRLHHALCDKGRWAAKTGRGRRADRHRRVVCGLAASSSAWQAVHGVTGRRGRGCRGRDARRRPLRAPGWCSGRFARWIGRRCIAEGLRPPRPAGAGAGPGGGIDRGGELARRPDPGVEPLGRYRGRTARGHSRIRIFHAERGRRAATDPDRNRRRSRPIFGERPCLATSRISRPNR